jgi:O-methyltransferase
MVCFERFFPQVTTGGVIILDDYYTWDGCTKALHDYLSKNQRSEPIIQTYKGGCYLIKR